MGYFPQRFFQFPEFSFSDAEGMIVFLSCVVDDEGVELGCPFLLTLGAPGGNGLFAAEECFSVLGEEL